MKLYLASTFSSGYQAGGTSHLRLNDREKAGVMQTRHCLESYHYIQKGKHATNIRRSGKRIFLDSGAFSAWTLGVEMSLPKYVQFIQDNVDIIGQEDDAIMASVLDGIGDPLKTWQNQMAMEGLGVRPLPCFHFGEDARYLDWYVAHYSYITLGGMVGKRSSALVQWLDEVWENNLTDGAGRPKLKVHAFGMTNETILERYPWYSVDSAAWVQRAAYGMIVHPAWGNIFVSDKSPTRHKEGYHLTNMSALEQERIKAELVRQGYDLERLACMGEPRAAYNIWAYQKHGERLHARAPAIFARQQEGLF